MRVNPVFLASLLFASTAFADAETTSFNISPVFGAFLPTGDQKKDLKSSVMSGIQMGYDLPAPVRLVGRFAWAPSRDKEYADARRNLYQYDAGIEVTPRREASERWKLRPFAGAGLGARSERENALTSSNQTNFAGYGSVGGSMGGDRLGARLEFRDGLSRFKEPEGTSTRNAFMVTGGLTFRI